MSVIQSDSPYKDDNARYKRTIKSFVEIDMHVFFSFFIFSCTPNVTMEKFTIFESMNDAKLLYSKKISIRAPVVIVNSSPIPLITSNWSSFLTSLKKSKNLPNLLCTVQCTVCVQCTCTDRSWNQEQHTVPYSKKKYGNPKPTWYRPEVTN